MRVNIANEQKENTNTGYVFDEKRRVLSATMPDEMIVTFDVGLPLSVPTCSISRTTPMPSTTSPKTTCRPSSHGIETVVTKNCAENFIQKKKKTEVNRAS